MPVHFLFGAPLGLLPVVVFLLALLHFDSYRLVSLKETIGTLIAGALLAGAAYLANAYAISALDMEFTGYSHYVAPFVEEALKAGALIYLFARNRVGFMIDAAIMGFSIGTGFAIVENIYYLYASPDANIGAWIIRGFGTAIMHGGATAMFGVLAQSLTERHSKLSPLYYLPGIAAAVVLHAAYNYFEAMPLLATALLLAGLPAIFLFVFTKSEHKVHTWLLSDYESHEHLLEEIRSGEFTHGEAARFILDLAAKVDPKVVADMFEYIQLHTELVLRAEKKSMAHETGEKIPATKEDHEKFARLHMLEREIGRTTFMTLWPHLHYSRRELWEMHELEGEGGLHLHPQ